MLLRNIKKRGREYEQSSTGEYLESIAQGYFDFFKQHPDYTFLIIETSKLDFVANQHDFNKIKSAIFDKTYPNGVNRLTF